MNTLGDIAKALNRSPVYLAGLQKRFELPVIEGAEGGLVARGVHAASPSELRTASDFSARIGTQHIEAA